MLPEVIIVALTIYMEAAGEPLRGKLGVGQVIQQRMIKRDKSADEVCLEHKQFSGWNIGPEKVEARHMAGKYIRNDIDKKAWRDCLAIAGRVCHLSLPGGRCWNHYHSIFVTPSWSDKMKDVEIIGNHIFGRIL